MSQWNQHLSENMFSILSLNYYCLHSEVLFFFLSIWANLCQMCFLWKLLKTLLICFRIKTEEGGCWKCQKTTLTGARCQLMWMESNLGGNDYTHRNVLHADLAALFFLLCFGSLLSPWQFASCKVKRRQAKDNLFLAPYNKFIS